MGYPGEQCLYFCKHSAFIKICDIFCAIVYEKIQVITGYMYQ